MRQVLPLVLLILLAPSANAGAFTLDDPLPEPPILECPAVFEAAAASCCPSACAPVADDDPPWALIGIAVVGIGALAWTLWPDGGDDDVPGMWRAFPHDAPTPEPYVCDDCDDIVVVPTPPAVWMGLLGLMTALWWWRRH